MKTSALRIKLLSWWLAGAFFVWCIVAYFAGGHDYLWLICLKNPIMWPLILPLVSSYSAIGHWLAPGDPREVAPSIWVHLDLIADVLFVALGTLWHWLLGRLISFLATIVLPRRVVGEHA